MPLVRPAPILLGQPLRVGRHMRQRLVGHRVQRLTQQLPALLDLVGGHVVQTGVVRVLVVRLGELRIELGEHRVVRPRFARWTRLGELREPQLEPLMAGVGRQQAVQGRGPRARQSGDEDGPHDRNVGVLRVLLERRLGDQPGYEGVADEEAVHLAAELGQLGIAGERVQQHRQGLAVVVVVGAKIVQPAGFGRRGMQILDGPHIGARRHQALYSPQLTSRAWPVIPLDRSLAMNRIAEATSFSVGNRFRSDAAAVAL